jgi:hypothetical protein
MTVRKDPKCLANSTLLIKQGPAQMEWYIYIKFEVIKKQRTGVVSPVNYSHYYTQVLRFDPALGVIYSQKA